MITTFIKQIGTRRTKYQFWFEFLLQICIFTILFSFLIYILQEATQIEIMFCDDNITVKSDQPESDSDSDSDSKDGLLDIIWLTTVENGKPFPFNLSVRVKPEAQTFVAGSSVTVFIITWWFLFL